jgi:transcriptional regulator with XRE-family HTH domain
MFQIADTLCYLKMYGGQLVREARRRAGLTQTQLAERAGTTQSAIARLERGDVEPGFHRVIELVRAAGLDLRVGLVEYDDHDWSIAAQNLQISPARRVRNLKSFLESVERARAALGVGRGG